jgi:hypothetical protein
MKISVTPDPSPEFEPITVSLTIENADELAALWHRLDVGAEYLVKRYGADPTPSVRFAAEWVGGPRLAGKDSTEQLFHAVDQLAMRRGLRGGGKIGH